MTIHLHQLKFFAYHGLYDAERILGGEFEVNADIEFDTPGYIQQIEETIDYTAMYKLISVRMAKPTHLLETVAQDIAVLVHEADPRVKKITIQINKKAAPIDHFSGIVGITYSKEF